MANPTGLNQTNLEERTVTMATDLSAKQYFFVNLDTTVDNKVAIAADGLKIAWPLMDGKDGSVNSATGSIAVSGQAKITLGGTVGPGIPVMPDTAGKAVVATDGKYYSGVTMQGGVAGDVVIMDVCHGVFKTVS